VLELKVSKQESLQLQAANKAINGDFDQAVSLMKESLGVQANENPFWVFQAPITIEMTGVAKEIGNGCVLQIRLVRTNSFSGTKPSPPSCTTLMVPTRPLKKLSTFTQSSNYRQALLWRLFKRFFKSFVMI